MNMDDLGVSQFMETPIDTGSHGPPRSTFCHRPETIRSPRAIVQLGLEKKDLHAAHSLTKEQGLIAYT